MAPLKRLRPNITQSDLARYLATQDDFALELFAASEARRAGFDVTHGGTYEDPVTGKHRQFDVRAVYVRDSREVALAIECKALRANFPLLVSRIPRSDAESKHDIIHTHRTYTPIPDYVPGGQITVSPSPVLYPAEAPVGKSMTQIGLNSEGEFVSSDSETYDKWAQALTSLSDLVAGGWRGHERSLRRDYVCVALPVLVISDTTLWTVDYDAAGVITGGPCQQASVEHYVGRVYAGPGQHKFVSTHLHIITKSALARFLNQLANDPAHMDALFPSADLPTSLVA